MLVCPDHMDVKEGPPRDVGVSRSQGWLGGTVRDVGVSRSHGCEREAAPAI